MLDVCCLMLDAWCLRLDAWCLMLAVWCLMLNAWCLMLDAWCLNTCQTHPQRVPQRGGGRRPPPLCGGGWRPPPFVDGSGRCSSIKHQASSIKHQASSIKHQASSIKHLFCHQSTHHGSWSTFDQTDIDYFPTRLFQSLGFPDFQMSHFKKNEYGRFGIINPVENRLVSIRMVFWSFQSH